MGEARVPWWRTDLGEAEIAAVTEAIRSRRISQGPLVARLEERLAEAVGLPHVVATTSGSVALLLAMLACDAEPGDEIVVPAATFIAPAHAARLLGCRVALAEVGPERPLLAADSVAEAIGARCRAVVAVHLNGRICAVDAVAEACGDRIAVIEDCAQAFLSRSGAVRAGARGRAAAFSLGLTKLVTAGEGGFVATAEAPLAQRMRRLRNHGVESIARNVFEGLGCNFRMTDMQAAIACAQLDRVDDKVAGVRAVYDFYSEALEGLDFLRMLEVRTDLGEIPLWTEVLCSERDRVVAHLGERGIEAKAFHPSLADSPHLSCDRELPNAARFARLGLTLPSGPDQPRADLERVVDALRELRGKVAALQAA